MNTNSARTGEAGINQMLARALAKRHPRWPEAVHWEQSGLFAEASGERPDILIRHPDGLPVVVETEFLPAPSVENDAEKRLGRHLQKTGDPVEVAIAVRIPGRLAKIQQHTLDDELEKSEFEFCLLADSEDGPPARWPESGWLEGGVDTLALCIERASLSENQVARGMSILEDGVRQAAGKLRESSGQATLDRIAATLNQRDSEQTSRMAMAIVANAMVFHHAIAGEHKVEQLEELRDEDNQRSMSNEKVIACWEKILREINYWPIFRIACDILEKIRPKTAAAILNLLAESASQLDRLGTTSRHDLCGRMFQSLIADRKFLATFYTLPTSSALLAELTTDRLQVDWSDPDALGTLKIGDFACGTGALLGAAYHSCLSQHRRAGGDDRNIHRTMIEEALTATDIMPAAVHLTASMLASAHPSSIFRKTRIAVLPYGSYPEEIGVSIGALDLIQKGATLSLFPTGEQAVHGTANIENKNGQPPQIQIPHESFDLVIMNPPFTNPTNHKTQTVPIPSFAGLGTSEDEAKMMSAALKKLRQPGQAGNGNAGLASNFIDLAHAKTKAGGILALVLPASFLQGDAWKSARRLLNQHYADLTIVSIATTGQTNQAFSADTGMAEILLVGSKKAEPDSSDASVLYVNIRNRPRTVLEGAMLARTICSLPPLQESGTLSIAKGVAAGSWIRGTLSQTGAASVRELQLVRSSVSLIEDGILPVPASNETVMLPLTALGDLGKRGLLHRDINEVGSQTNKRRGPFDIEPISQGEFPDRPVLWRHDAKRETRLTVAPDKKALAAAGFEERAAQVWGTASRLHFSQEFRLNSQPIVTCLTPERSLGGRAWPNFLCDLPEWETPLALWANTTLGLVCWWWIGTRQQNGRAIVSISRLPELTVLDPRTLDKPQLRRMQEIWDEFQDRDFLPANESWRDDTRRALDSAVFGDVLGFPQQVLGAVANLRMQWCAEPSVHGGKNTAPQNV